ncbi:MAG: SDR family oxidoreductase [Candidatus Bathyarchaeia archaeon]
MGFNRAFGIRECIIFSGPGVVETDMTASLPAEYTRIRVEETPMKRTGKPEEVARAALFLASEDSDFITGEIIKVAGGRGMR